ncbi:MAG: YIP1 family protein [Bacteroidota bacterium]
MRQILTIAKVGIKDFVEIIHGTLTSSENNWKKLKASEYQWKEMFFFYVFPLVILNSLAKILVVPEQSEFQILEPGTLFVVYLMSSVISLLLGSFLIMKLSPRYQSVNNFDTIFTFVGVSYTPIFLSNMIAVMHPYLAIVSLLGIIYTIFLFYRGIGIMLETPAIKKTGFTILCFLILFGSTIFASALVSYLAFFLTGNMDSLMNFYS